MTQEHASINGALLRLRREARGWVQSDVATRACMSVKQIKQLEDGGLSAFYSEAVKVTAAKKVGALLGLTPDEIFSHGQPEVATAASSISPEADLAALLASTHDEGHDEPYEAELAHASHHGHSGGAGHAGHTAHATAAHPSSLHPSSVHASPVYATPSADSEASHHDSNQTAEEALAHVSSGDHEAHDHSGEAHGHAHASASHAVDSHTHAEPVKPVTATTSAASKETKSKASLLWLVALFIGAIVLAAVFKPEQEAAPTEPPPPLQPALQSEPGEAGKDGVAPADASAGNAPAAAPGTPANGAPVNGAAPAAGTNAPANAPAPAPATNAPSAVGASSSAPAAGTAAPAAATSAAPAAAAPAASSAPKN
jgi:transcriptional regulator with XRE-family HTH domain